jgi:TctA family transporter
MPSADPPRKIEQVLPQTHEFVCAVIGADAFSSSTFGVWVMLALGIFGLFLLRHHDMTRL